ncbi:MAG: hypothetical protein KG012_11485 [Deltaproteobacteria bacterium]|nr:hypothetical protein [Deltaproteobacteria bacterium]
MSGNTRIFALVAAGLLVVFFYWYFFVDTLKLTQITGKPENAYASIFVNIIDFDTGLSRYDIYNLSRRSDYWQRRIREVESIQDPERRNMENAKLLAEMMEDPSIKKIAKKLIGFGTDAVLSIMRAIK